MTQLILFVCTFNKCSWLYLSYITVVFSRIADYYHFSKSSELKFRAL